MGQRIDGNTFDTRHYVFAFQLLFALGSRYYNIILYCSGTTFPVQYNKINRNRSDYSDLLSNCFFSRGLGINEL